MHKALVIGCGNIGALYDFESDNIETHAKAYFHNPNFNLAIYDTDRSVVERISKKYNCSVEHSIKKHTLSGYDVVSICTPTKTHYGILKSAIEAQVKVIICEKPISTSKSDLLKLEKLYTACKSKILVNYIRRFQAPYHELKYVNNKINTAEELTSIDIRYQRGFYNNCSHAFDTVEYVVNDTIELQNVKIHNPVYDHFSDDPTLSLQGTSKGASISVTGLPNIGFSIFEIDLYYKFKLIRIYDSGKKIDVYATKNPTRDGKMQSQQLVFSQQNCLNNYMENVIEEAQKLLFDRESNDNFLSSLALNQRMIDYKGYADA
jgi:hypothetical protein